MPIDDKVEKIREAELAYSKRIEDAKAEADRLIKKAFELAQQRVQEDITAAKKDAEIISLKADEEIKNRIIEVEDQVSKDLKDLLTKMSKKRDLLIKFVQDRIAGLDVS